MRQSGDWAYQKELTKGDFLKLYEDCVDSVDFLQAASDVLPFIRDPREIDVWSRDFFHSLAGRFRFS
jgi:hypothetical protein